MHAFRCQLCIFLPFLIQIKILNLAYLRLKYSLQVLVIFINLSFKLFYIFIFLYVDHFPSLRKVSLDISILFIIILFIDLFLSLFVINFTLMFTVYLSQLYHQISNTHDKGYYQEKDYYHWHPKDYRDLFMLIVHPIRKENQD